MPFSSLWVAEVGSVKDIQVKVIPGPIANKFVKNHHYSGKIVNNSIIHFGAFLNGRLHGVMSFGNPIDKRNVLPLVNTDNETMNQKWNEMLELNRMAFDQYLPRNSESRCISVAIRLIKKNAPHIKWILSFADGTQCGDGTIYRASGFLLTAVNKNTTIVELPSGEKIARHGTSKRDFKGANTLPGFQLRYILLIDKTAEIAVEIIPFSKIEELGAGMYLGEKISNAREAEGSKRPASSRKEGGSSPTSALQINEVLANG